MDTKTKFVAPDQVSKWQEDYAKARRHMRLSATAAGAAALFTVFAVASAAGQYFSPDVTRPGCSILETEPAGLMMCHNNDRLLKGLFGGLVAGMSLLIVVDSGRMAWRLRKIKRNREGLLQHVALPK